MVDITVVKKIAQPENPALSKDDLTNALINKAKDLYTKSQDVANEANKEMLINNSLVLTKSIIENSAIKENPFDDKKEKELFDFYKDQVEKNRQVQKEEMVMSSKKPDIDYDMSE